MKQSDIYDKVAFDFGLKPSQVEKAYKHYWKIIRNWVRSFPDDKDISQEEYEKLKLNITVTHLGKFYAPYYVYKKKIEDEKIKEDKATAKSRYHHSR